MHAENLNIQPLHNGIPKNQNALTYGVQEIAKILSISKRTAYEFCKKTSEFKVIHIGRCVRVHKESFDKWFAGDVEAENSI